MVNLGNSHLFRFGPFDADFVRKLILYKRLRRICPILSGKSRLKGQSLLVDILYRPGVFGQCIGHNHAAFSLGLQAFLLARVGV